MRLRGEEEVRVVLNSNHAAGRGGVAEHAIMLTGVSEPGKGVQLPVVVSIAGWALDGVCRRNHPLASILKCCWHCL
jgi:hypothetical protein